jgi:hypothetical protein
MVRQRAHDVLPTRSQSGRPPAPRQHECRTGRWPRPGVPRSVISLQSARGSGREASESAPVGARRTGPFRSESTSSESTPYGFAAEEARCDRPAYHGFRRSRDPEAGRDQEYGRGEEPDPECGHPEYRDRGSRGQASGEPEDRGRETGGATARGPNARGQKTGHSRTGPREARGADAAHHAGRRGRSWEPGHGANGVRTRAAPVP